MVSAVNMHTSNIIQIEQVTFRNMHEYTCVHVTTINNKGCEFERARRGVYGSVWREARDRGNGVVVLSSQN